MEKKKAIVVTSFGTSFLDVLEKTIGVCEKEIVEAFPDFTIKRAFTSHMVRKSLAEKEGLMVPALEEVLTELSAEGYEEVYIQPLHVIPGEEYHEKIIKPAMPFKKDFSILRIGKTLLYSTPEYYKVIEALKEQLLPLEEDTCVLLMGHGATHPANACYASLQLKLLDEIPGVFIANVEGYPELEDMLHKISMYTRARLMPLMLVAGDHAMNDMAGDEEDSWKSILESQGYQVQVEMKGLGENPAIRKIYQSHIQEMLEK